MSGVVSHKGAGKVDFTESSSDAPLELGRVSSTVAARTPDNAYLGWVPIRTGFGLYGQNGQIPVVRRPDKMSAEIFKFLQPCPDKSRYFDRAHRSLSGQDLIKSDSVVVTLYVFVKILN